MMKLRKALSAIFVALCLQGPVAVALGQDVTGDRVQAAIEATDERIDLAQSVVLGTGNTQAELEVQMAIEIQSQARQAFVQAQSSVGDVQLRWLRQALDLTLRARAHADRGIAIVRGLPDPERVIAQIERTSELIERARDRIEECGRDRARALLRVATEMQKRAEAAVQDGRYLAALQLTLSARERALRALRLCNADDNLQEACERALRRTDDVLDRAREVVSGSGSEVAREALARAINLQERAHSQFRAGNFEASLRLTQSARSLAHRVLRLAGRGR